MSIKPRKRSETSRSFAEEYPEIDFRHGPFCFPLKPEWTRGIPQVKKFHPVLCPEVDRTEMYKMEKIAFHVLEILTPDFLNSKTVNSGHPIQKARTSLLKSTDELMGGVALIQDTHSYFLQKRGNKVSEGKEANAADQRIQKGLMENHFTEKRNYWERAAIFLNTLRQNQQVREDSSFVPDLINPDMKTPYQNYLDDYADITECIRLAHTYFPKVRSAAHHLGTVRKNGDLVIEHVYEATLDIINMYMPEIRDSTNPKRRRHLFWELKLAIIYAITHDYLEDFGDLLGIAFSISKGVELTLNDTVNEIEYQSTDTNETEGIPKISSFSFREVVPIYLGLLALTKPGKERDNILQELNSMPLLAINLNHLIGEVLGMMNRTTYKAPLKWIFGREEPPHQGEEELEPHIRKQILEELPLKIRYIVLRVKIADRKNNIRTLNGMPLKNQSKKLKEGIQLVENGIWAFHNIPGDKWGILRQLTDLAEAVVRQVTITKQNIENELTNLTTNESPAGLRPENCGRFIKDISELKNEIINIEINGLKCLRKIVGELIKDIDLSSSESNKKVA